jgi:nitrite reductase/ring-hydroxylating ferredoxin subunit
MNWYRILDVQLTGKPFIKKVKAGGKTFCLVSVDDKIYALSAKCPHAGGDLTQGWCKEGKLICPVHRYSYNIETGKGSEGQNDYIKSYPVEIREGLVYIGINSFWESLKQAFKS